MRVKSSFGGSALFVAPVAFMKTDLHRVTVTCLGLPLGDVFVPIQFLHFHSARSPRVLLGVWGSCRWILFIPSARNKIWQISCESQSKHSWNKVSNAHRIL